MGKVALTGGAYEARSLIANAQRCVNLIPEPNPPDAPFPFTHYPAPGLIEWAVAPAGTMVRGEYTANNGEMFAIVDDGVYYVSPIGVYTLLGSITPGTTPVSMVDNGLVLVLVDGTANGYAIKLSTHAFSAISTTSAGETVFYGSDFVQYVDTFFVFNRPGTQQFYISASNATYELLIGSGQVVSGSVVNGSSGLYGTYGTVALTGGSGTGATGTLTINKGTAKITSVTIVDGGSNYAVGDILGAAIYQAVTFSFVGGAGYTNGVHANVTLVGSHSGTIIIPSITVAGGIVTAMTSPVTSNYNRFTVGDTFTDATGALGAGAGFLATATAVAAADSGFQFHVDEVGSGAFDPLDIAAKTGFADDLVAAFVIHREIWLIGQKTTEVWYNTGAADFTFGIMPGVFIEHGCIAKYSIAKADLSLFWLSQDKEGNTLVLEGVGYQAKRISTHALEAAIQAYATVSDATGFTYQQGGHCFYELTFPSADATWCYDMSTALWHQRASIDGDGNLKRHRSNSVANAYGKILVGDYENGTIYELDQDTYTDNGVSIPRIRSFPHLVNDGKRQDYSSFIADMETGNAGGILAEDAPKVSLRWSDDHGRTWGNPIEQSLGSGQFGLSLKWARLGMAYDRVFELSWSADVKTALNGAFVEV